MSDRFVPLTDALIDAALGVSHMMARDRDGKWTEVTDPVVMARVLDSGETFYRIHPLKPDVKALKDIFDRRFGSPVQAVEVTGDEDKPVVFRWKK